MIKYFNAEVNVGTRVMGKGEKNILKHLLLAFNWKVEENLFQWTWKLVQNKRQKSPQSWFFVTNSLKTFLGKKEIMWEPLNGASVNGFNNKPAIRVRDRLMGISFILLYLRPKNERKKKWEYLWGVTIRVILVIKRNFDLSLIQTCLFGYIRR